MTAGTLRNRDDDNLKMMMRVIAKTVISTRGNLELKALKLTRLHLGKSPETLNAEP